MHLFVSECVYVCVRVVGVTLVTQAGEGQIFELPLLRFRGSLHLILSDCP